MSFTLIQTTDDEFLEYLSRAYADGYKKAVEELSGNTDWVDEATACQMLGIKPNTLKMYRHDRRVEYQGTRGNIKYSKESIDAIIAERTKPRV